MSAARAPQIDLIRLTRRAQFLFVREGLRASRANVLIEARRRADSGPTGVGFTASKKVGSAVLRNRARRRLREAARPLLAEYGLPGVDYVLVARQSTPDAAWEALLDDVGNALIRLRADLSAGRGQNPRKSKPAKPRSRATESD
ncbi:ribonuclease P protein component [Terricaulis sp.]|uniref:ribonuclease P protein component n=1 Tax=Terricaulis sp. TaxID=2768686 RepID=UPI003784A930